MSRKDTNDAKYEPPPAWQPTCECESRESATCDPQNEECRFPPLPPPPFRQKPEKPRPRPDDELRRDKEMNDDEGTLSALPPLESVVDVVFERWLGDPKGGVESSLPAVPVCG